MNKHLIHRDAPLLDALRMLNDMRGSSLTLFAIDSGGRITGTLTDGDIRRALLAGATTGSPVSAAEHREFRSVGGPVPDVAALRELRMRGITLVPQLRPDGTPERIIDLSETPTLLPMRALLMAGGKGQRLLPLTATCPKPLLEIGGKAIIDYNIEALAAAGIDDITVSTGHMAEQIEAHFASPVAGVNVRTVRETSPLGTIGAASMLDCTRAGLTLVMNSDLLTTISYEEMYLHHRAEQAAVTIAVIPYTVSVPYAILTTDGSRVTGLEEKPTYSHYANAGIYIFDNDVLAQVPAGERTDATDLILQAIAEGRKVAYYTIRGTWIDVGTPADFRQAEDLLRHARNFSPSRAF